jgi:peptidoglycan/LPS O-acetylase OafA/YrhL
MDTKAATKSYYPALDGLRGIGCALIIIYHLFPFINQYLFFSFLAMDIFFVLSGFLITDILLNSFGQKDYLKNFYVRRLLRVFPLYYTSLIFFILILPNVLQMPIDIVYYVHNQSYFWVFLQNWLLIFKPVNEHYINHLWSMGVEEQFYLLWPLLFAVVKRPKILLGFLIMLLLSFCAFRFYIWTHPITDLSYYNFYAYTRIDGICIGCMIALMQKINSKFVANYMGIIVLAFALINFAFYELNLQHNNSFPYLALIGYSTFSMVFGVLVHTIINNNSKFFTAVFDVSFFKFLGRISYGTYVFHLPLYVLAGPYIIKWFSQNLQFASPYLLGSIFLTILSFSLGWLSYRYFEMPFLRLKKHFA